MELSSLEVGSSLRYADLVTKNVISGNTVLLLLVQATVALVMTKGGTRQRMSPIYSIEGRTLHEIGLNMVTSLSTILVFLIALQPPKRLQGAYTWHAGTRRSSASGSHLFVK